MHQGNWTCSKCGGEITELPFEPRSTSGLTCRNCYFKAKDAQASAAGTIDDQTATPAATSDDGTSQKQTFTGEWQCAECGGPITELPFEPRDTSNLRCRDCFRKSKAAA